MNRWAINLIIILLLGISAFTFTGCGKSATGCVTTGGHQDLATGPKGPRKIYVPAYYLYRNGKYQFVKGHYRWVLNRKTYFARANRGYTNRVDEAAAR